MKPQGDTAYGINRLQSKAARAAIIQKISSDFNLMPIIAEAYYKQIASYFAQHAEAVDRYIRDYEIVKTVRAATDDIDKISQITRLSKRVISQYLDLIPQHLLNDIDAKLATKSQTKDATPLSSSKLTGGTQ